MRATSSIAALAALANLALADGALTFNTPTTSIQTCRPLLLSWTGGTAPYYVTIVDGASLSSVVEQLNSVPTSSTEATWLVSVIGSVVMQVVDAQGVTAQTAPVTIAAGSDTSCVGEVSIAYADQTFTGGSATGAPATSAPTSAPTAAITSTTTSSSDSKSSGTTSAPTSAAKTATAVPASQTTAPASSSGASGAVRGSLFAAAALAGAVALFA